MQNLVETPGDFSDLLYRQTVVNVPALDSLEKSGDSLEKSLWSLRFSLCTNRCRRSVDVSDRATRRKCCGFFAILSMCKPLPTFQAWFILVISWSYPGTRWMNSDASGKSPGNVDHGTATVNRLIRGLRLLTSITLVQKCLGFIFLSQSIILYLS